ncbi:MAG TPA: Type 1 glutamine amidotransferase-like domain-containing protein [Acidimicrobiia bacterium]|nr:Type 1 glutamine amidotransferase-like domain-containing protein [Acidimicrobiia bacterium]
MSPNEASGTLALVGGGEWHDGCRDFDAELLAQAGDEVVVLPTAAAFEHPDRVVERATEYFAGLGASVRGLTVLRRADAEDRANVAGVEDAGFVYIADGSPLHLRSALKDSALFDAIVTAYRSGSVLAASGAGATVVCDPMVDPRGGAYTVGLGVVRELAVFPYHGTAADHLRERSIDLLPRTATLVGLDEQTALIREPDVTWRVAGAGVVTLYDGRQTTVVEHGSKVERLRV